MMLFFLINSASSTVVYTTKGVVNPDSKFTTVLFPSNQTGITVAVKFSERILFKPGASVSAPINVAALGQIAPGKGQFKFYYMTPENKQVVLSNKTFVELDSPTIYIELEGFMKITDKLPVPLAFYFAFSKDLYIVIIETDATNYTTAAYPDITGFKSLDRMVSSSSSLPVAGSPRNSLGANITYKFFRPGFRLYLYTDLSSIPNFTILESYGSLKSAKCTYLFEDLAVFYPLTVLDRRVSRASPLPSGKFLFMFDVEVESTSEQEFFYFRGFSAVGVSNKLSNNSVTYLLSNNTEYYVFTNGYTKLFLPPNEGLKVYMEPFDLEKPLEDGQFYDIKGPLKVDCKTNLSRIYGLGIVPDIFNYETIVQQMENIYPGEETTLYWVFPSDKAITERNYTIIYSGFHPKYNSITIHKYDANLTLLQTGNLTNGVLNFTGDIFVIIYHATNNSHIDFDFKNSVFHVISTDNVLYSYNPVKPGATKSYVSSSQISNYIMQPNVLTIVHKLNKTKIVYDDKENNEILPDEGTFLYSSQISYLSVHMKKTEKAFPSIPISSVYFNLSKCDMLDIVHSSKPYWYGSNSRAAVNRNFTLKSSQQMCIWMISFGNSTYSVDMKMGSDANVTLINGDKSYPGVDFPSILAAPVAKGSMQFSTKQKPKSDDNRKIHSFTGVNDEDIKPNNLFVIIKTGNLPQDSSIEITADTEQSSELGLSELYIRYNTTSEVSESGLLVPQEIPDNNIFKPGVIAGIVIACIAFIGIVAGAVVYYVIRAKKKKESDLDYEAF